jgi:hypothetical protein
VWRGKPVLATIGTNLDAAASLFVTIGNEGEDGGATQVDDRTGITIALQQNLESSSSLGMVS